MLKILIVDDDEATLKLMRIRLSEAYEAICTRDPEQALGLALEHKPDAILLDLMMPKFSGFELCQSLRSLSYTSAIPIIVITGELDAKYKEHCRFCHCVFRSLCKALLDVPNTSITFCAICGSPGKGRKSCA